MRKLRLPGILYFTLITFATRESVPRPPGRPCYPVPRDENMPPPNLLLWPANHLELKAPEKQRLQAGSSALPVSTSEQSLGFLGERRPTPPGRGKRSYRWRRGFEAEMGLHSDTFFLE